MEIRGNKDICIITPLCESLDRYKTQKILDLLTQEKRHTALDLSYVSDCSIDFIEGIKTCVNKNIGIFNIPSDIFVLFNFMNIDKFAKLYVSESDFKSDSRQLINRKFALV